MESKIELTLKNHESYMYKFIFASGSTSTQETTNWN